MSSLAPRPARAAAIVLLSAAPSVALAQAQAPTSNLQPPTTQRAFVPTDIYRMSTVSAPAMSPDGRLVAFTVTTVVEKENRRHREVWAVPTAGGPAVRYSSPAAESSEPRFSADGKYLLFTSKRPNVKETTWALRLDKPAGEAFPADSLPRAGSGTSTPRDRSFVVWSDSIPADTSASSPDSATSPKDPWAKMMEMARPPYGAITHPIDAARFDGRHITDLRFKSNDRGYVPGPRTARVWRPLQIWTQRFDGTPKRQLTRDAYSHFGAAVSPDGRWIAFAADTGLRADSVVQAEKDSLARLPYDSARDEREPNALDVFVIPAAGCDADCRPRRLRAAAVMDDSFAELIKGLNRRGRRGRRAIQEREPRRTRRSRRTAKA